MAGGEQIGEERRGRAHPRRDQRSTAAQRSETREGEEHRRAEIEEERRRGRRGRAPPSPMGRYEGGRRLLKSLEESGKKRLAVFFGLRGLYWIRIMIRIVMDFNLI